MATHQNRPRWYSRVVGVISCEVFMTTTNYDIVICGGGMIGAGLASVLAQQELSIAIIEPNLPREFCITQPVDLRVSALLPAAQAILQRTRAWDNLIAMRAAILQRMRVWEQEGVGDVSFCAQDMGANRLGYIVENRVTQLALWQALQDFPNVAMICPATPVAINKNCGCHEVTMDNGDTVRCRLLVAADGGDSFVREQLGMGVQRYRYQQACLVAAVNTELGQQDITWQRFVPTGPQAFLPLLGQHGSVVWYHHADEINRLARLSNDDLSDAIMEAFPAQLGRIEVTAKGHFPLQKMHAFAYVEDGVALIGDAAHMINPLAGQGVNLGFRDIACFERVISNAFNDTKKKNQKKTKGQAWWSKEVLLAYQQQRRTDNCFMMEAMHGLYHGFSNEHQGLGWLRNKALSAANIPLIKQSIMAYAMDVDNGTGHKQGFVNNLSSLESSYTEAKAYVKEKVAQQMARLLL